MPGRQFVVDIDSSGRAIVAMPGTQTGQEGLWISHYDPQTAEWSPRELVSTEAVSVGQADLRMDAAGNALVAWTVYDEAGLRWSRFDRAEGSWSSPVVEGAMADVLLEVAGDGEQELGLAYVGEGSEPETCSPVILRWDEEAGAMSSPIVAPFNVPGA